MATFWAYLPDAGEVFAELMDREGELAPFERFHLRGHWDADGTEMIAAIRKAAGNESIPARSLPWWIFRLASPFHETMRELYATVGKEPHTPLQAAVEATRAKVPCCRAGADSGRGWLR